MSFGVFASGHKLDIEGGDLFSFCFILTGDGVVQFPPDNPHNNAAGSCWFVSKKLSDECAVRTLAISIELRVA